MKLFILPPQPAFAAVWAARLSATLPAEMTCFREIGDVHGGAGRGGSACD